MNSPTTVNMPGNKFLRNFALATFIVTSLLLFTGGLTTTIGAGMAFPDWPLSNGSINPDGWLTDSAMRAEHSHRITGSIIGLLTLILCIFTWRREPRQWVKYIALGALILVILQGLLGGLRVLFDSLTFAMIHGCLAQLFLCTLATLFVVQTKTFTRKNDADGAGLSATTVTLSQALFILCVCQLIVAVIMRHMGAGLAIHTFPLTPEGGLVPSEWSAPVTIHFLHRVLAAVIVIAWAVWLWHYRKDKPASPALRNLANTTLVLLFVQIALGALTVWTIRHPYIATLHVLTGAYLLATLWLNTLVTTFYYRTAASRLPRGAVPNAAQS